MCSEEFLIVTSSGFQHFNEYMEELRKLHAGKKLDETYEYDDYYIDIPSPSYSDEEIAYIAANHLYVEDDVDKKLA